jgi:FkbM family methyltransferase
MCFARTIARAAVHDPTRLDLGAAFRIGTQLGAMKIGANWGSLKRFSIPGSARSAYLRPDTTDADVFEQIFLQRQYDMRSFPQYETISRYSPADMLVLDCGAYIGLSTIWFSERFPGARIFAVEPDAENYALLVQNTRDIPNVVPVNAAVWDRECRLMVADPSPKVPKYAVTIVESDEERSDLVDATTIPKLMACAGSYACVVVKLDIEGGESAVFRSNTDWLNAANVVLIELHDWLYPGRHRSRNFFRALLEHDFEVVLSGENLICFQEVSDVDHPL